jgi:hypothetical protein
VTWQLHRHASPEQIAAFILRYHAWKQQQQQQRAVAAKQANTVAVATAAATATLAPAARRAATARNTLQRLQRIEGYSTLPLDCIPLSSTLRRAQQLLAQGRAVDALYQLCPGSSSLLFVYAGQYY